MHTLLGWVVIAAFAWGVWSLLRWPLRKCRWCKGKGRHTRRTLFGNTVSRPCGHCVSGWRLRLGAKTKGKKR